MYFRFRQDISDHLHWAYFKAQATQLRNLEKGERTEEDTELVKRLVGFNKKLMSLMNEFDYWFEPEEPTGPDPIM